MSPTSHLVRRTAALAVLACCASAAQAADWSDTSLSYRYGTKFAEPFNDNDITKNIVNFSSVSGYKYGKNFLQRRPADVVRARSIGGRFQ
jgi:opacity protein-like surface antigen